MAYAWQTSKDPNYTASVATKKYGAYDTGNYDYTWDGAYLNRTKKPNAAPTILESEGQKQGRLSLQDLLANPKTYSGQLTADNAYSGQIESSLNSYLNRTNPESLNMAEQELQRTLSPTEYDPNTSQYYKGVREAANLNLNDALNQYQRRQLLTGNLRSTTADMGRSRLLAENSANLDQILGTLANQERQNRLNAIGQAQSMAGFRSGEQLNSLNAVTQTSDYLTKLKQAALDAEYQKWKDQQAQQQSIAQLLYSAPITYVY